MRFRTPKGLRGSLTNVRVVKVEFQRVLGFKDVSVELNSQLQILAGPNNAGKSTLVRLLEVFFSDPTQEALLDLKPLNSYYASEGARSLSTITVHFGDLDHQERRAFNPIIRTQDKTFSISLRSTRKGSVSFEASKKPGVDESRRYYSEVLARCSYIKIPSIRMAGADVTDKDSMERLLDTLEAILIRKGNTRSTTLQQKYAEIIEPVEDLVRGVLDQSAAAIKNDLPFRENEVKFRLPESRYGLRGMLAAAVIESQGSIALPVSQRGTGFQSALVLGILRHVAEKEAQAGGNMFFAIEEPEAFLHPQTQRAMAKIIRDISSSAQVLVTTHSSVVVDSFSVDQIARLPLQPDGLEHEWQLPDLEPTDVGRLTRYCSAANSELVFASAAIFVEGEGDHAVVENLLARICGSPGGHYALGITVIEAGGIDKIRYLTQLADLFGVRSYVLADRDALSKLSGKRPLFEILKSRTTTFDAATRDKLAVEADRSCANLKTALQQQRVLNELLRPFDSFVLAADLEGLLLDMYGVKNLTRELGPDRHNALDKAFADKLLSGTDGAKQLASWMGSKGWNSTGAKSGKLQPHLPPLLIESWFDQHNTPGQALKPLTDWLGEIVKEATRAPL